MESIKIVAGARLLLSDHPVSHNCTNQLPHIAFVSSAGSNHCPVPSYSLALDSQNLIFSARLAVTGNYDSSLHCGDFRSDLWRNDVAELFIASDSGSYYQEFNIAPSGAYWTASFSDYRQLITGSNQPVEGVKTISVQNKNMHELAILIPRKSIISGCSFGTNSRICCCAISGNNPRAYYSTACLDKEKPDFHKISAWGEIEIRMFDRADLYYYDF